MRALFYIPSIVAALRYQVYFFIQGLPLITGQQLMRTAHVKREAKRIPETVGIYLRPGSRTGKRIIRRYIIRTSIDIDPQNITHQVGINILPVSTGIRCIPIRNMPITHIIRIAAVTDGDI